MQFYIASLVGSGDDPTLFRKRFDTTATQRFARPEIGVRVRAKQCVLRHGPPGFGEESRELAELGGGSEPLLFRLGMSGLELLDEPRGMPEPKVIVPVVFQRLGLNYPPRRRTFRCALQRIAPAQALVLGIAEGDVHPVIEQAGVSGYHLVPSGLGCPGTRIDPAAIHVYFPVLADKPGISPGRVHLDSRCQGERLGKAHRVIDHARFEQPQRGHALDWRPLLQAHRRIKRLCPDLFLAGRNHIAPIPQLPAKSSGNRHRGAPAFLPGKTCVADLHLRQLNRDPGGILHILGRIGHLPGCIGAQNLPAIFKKHGRKASPLRNDVEIAAPEELNHHADLVLA